MPAGTVVSYEYETKAEVSNERKMNKTGSDDSTVANNNAARIFSVENSQVETNQTALV